MHAEMRRVPVERARHAKRLGHVQILAAAVNTTTTTTQQGATATTATTPPATSAIPSSSSAHTSSSTTPSSSPATTPSTPSVALSTTTQSLSPPAPSIQSTLPATSTSTPLPPTSTPQTAAATTSGLSGSAIAGIIAGAVIVGALLIVFFVRKTYLRRRERRHISWNGPPGVGAGFLDEPKPLPDTNERAASSPQRSAPLSPFEAYGPSMYSTPVPPVVHMRSPNIPSYATPTPPPATYNNPTQVAAYPTHLIPPTYGPGNTTALTMARVAPGTPTLPSVRAQHAPLEAMVKCTFVPTLPDELSITTGERIFIVEQYDDGWDLCANVRGERGMVPRECLEHAPIDQPDIGWRNVRRTSSLNPDGTRF